MRGRKDVEMDECGLGGKFLGLGLIEDGSAVEIADCHFEGLGADVGELEDAGEGFFEAAGEGGFEEW